MSLRVKIALSMVALAVAVTAAVGVSSYLSTERTLRAEVDWSLKTAGEISTVTNRPPRGGVEPPGDSDGDGDPARRRVFTQIAVQVLNREGEIVVQPDAGALPVSERDRAIARGDASRKGAIRDVQIDGEPYRMLTVANRGGAAQLARSLAETERVLASIRNRTLLISLAASVIAAIAGVVIAEHITRRLVRLTEAATAVEQSGDLDVTVPEEGNDETSRLARAFNGMLASLSASRRAQRQLVQDAGHELRTPLTSLRTNIAVLQRHHDLTPESRQRLLADLDAETKELTMLVNEIVELATDQRDGEVESTVVLGEVAERVAERQRRRSGRAITVTHDGAPVVARPHALERAISNLIENALKFSTDAVDVTVEGTTLRVADRGPGVAPADRAKVFDRFYRSDEARALPGSGLGLSIVREMVDERGGTVFVDERPGGGAIVGFRLP
ncbi:MAG: ATP-binding protein [Ilumatobacteraceae bacterium]